MMEKEVERALEASIRKWERNASVTNIDDAIVCVHQCPLCALFFFEKECAGCPVAKRTGQLSCRGTSYRKAYDAMAEVKFWGKPLWAFLQPAEEYLDLLKSLRPPKRSKRTDGGAA